MYFCMQKTGLKREINNINTSRIWDLPSKKMILKQLQFNDSFPGCLKATAMDEASIALCFS